MRNLWVRRMLGGLGPEILAVLVAVFLAGPLAVGQNVQLRQADNYVLEITGGTGAQAWRLRYATEPNRGWQAHLVEAPENRAWFSHGTWLRLVDTRKGLVTGRWNFPGHILGLQPDGPRLRVEIDNPYNEQRRFRQTLPFDPNAPQIPDAPVNDLSLYRLPFLESQAMYRPRPGIFPKLAPAEAKELIPQAEEAVRRDPWSPWLRVVQAALLRDAGVARSRGKLEEAIRLQGLHFTELFRISAHLDELGERELAREAFERAYKDFLERGNDPRLFTVLIDRLILYPVNWVRIVPEQRSEVIERLYRLGPSMEGGEFAWELYASQLEKSGRAEDARIWRARAEPSEAYSFVFLPSLGLPLDRSILVAFAAGSAALLYLVMLYLRYRPQRRLDLAARPSERRGLAIFNLEYWDRRERVGFFLMVLTCWSALGVMGLFMQGVLRAAAMPVSLGMGSFAGPPNLWYLESRLPPTPQRDLFLALGYQQAGQKEKAERLYRGLPQFAESWNNLGVLLKDSGKPREAQQAFERAIEINPGLAEAALNLGRPPQDFWTEQFHKYLPGRPMLAPPRRAQAERALLGGSLATVCLRALGGPFTGSAKVGLLFSLFADKSAPPPVHAIIPIPLLLLALAQLFLFHSREVTQPPGPKHWLWELFFPGLSPAWRFMGWLALLAWCLFALQIILLLRIHTPYIVLAIALPNLAGAFGVGGDLNDVLRLVNPSWVWVYLPPALLFAVNLVLVWREKR